MKEPGQLQPMWKRRLFPCAHRLALGARRLAGVRECFLCPFPINLFAVPCSRPPTSCGCSSRAHSLS